MNLAGINIYTFVGVLAGGALLYHFYPTDEVKMGILAVVVIMLMKMTR